jgi:2-keto-3-deoxy-L-fuconate dehydrogenase
MENIINFGIREKRIVITQADEWNTVFGALVQPLPRLVRGILPQMMERKAEKIREIHT